VDGEHRTGADGDAELPARDRAPLSPFAGQEERDGDDEEREAKPPGGDGERARV